MADTIWAFDLGIGSIGEAVRLDNRFIHVASHLIPHDFAETKSAANRRRMWRTRLAHQAREAWLDACMREADIEVLTRRKFDEKSAIIGDERLEREFPQPGDQTCYNCAALRVKLLQGEKLKGWQIYKALNSAIQRRGFDRNLAWKRGQSDSDEEESLTSAKADDFEMELESMAPGKPEYHYPCYYEAFKMGLWSPNQPETVNIRINCDAKRARGKVYPRKIVEKEIRDLLEAAALLFPGLKGKADFILYGPGKTPYASYNFELGQKLGLRRGTADDWKGVLGQKIPRFDNRIIEKCVLIPRLNVCKIHPWKEVKDDPSKRLPQEFAFLMKLKNIRLQRGGKEDWLSAEEIAVIFEKRRSQTLSLTPGLWATECEQLGGHPLVGHEEVSAPREGGRSRYCRPALELFIGLILSGAKPSDYRSRVLKDKIRGNDDPKKGLIPSDLNFLQKLAETSDQWEAIYIPNEKLEAIQNQSESPDEAVGKVIGSVNDPVVRHRLFLFDRRIKELCKKFGDPGEVVLEFVREDFMGDKAKAAFTKNIKERTQKRIELKEAAEKAGQKQGDSALRMELLNQQKGICLYSGEPLIPSKLDDYEIDHIVPRKKGGANAVINYVLTPEKWNKEKGKLTPYEWFQSRQFDGWDAYLDRVRQRTGSLGNKKARLLTAPNAAELIEKYTSLAETAWISKLAQSILNIRFGWKNGNDEQGHKRIRVIPGGLTARVRERYELDGLLAQSGSGPGPLILEKNRSDPRHHALDAMVLTFIPGWMNDPKKRGFFRFPESIGDPKQLLQHYLDDLVPAQICFEKAQLEETIYGKRQSAEGVEFPVLRRDLKGLAFKGGGQQVEYNQDTLRESIQFYSNPVVRAQVEEWNQQERSEDEWKAFCAALDFSGINRTAYSPRALTAVRKALRDQAYRPVAKFDLIYLRKNIENIVDLVIRSMLTEWHHEGRTEAEWVEWCQKVRLPSKNGKLGPRISKVRLKVGELGGYKDLSPTGTEGFYRTTKAPYPGQILYRDNKGKIRVRPVYAFESQPKVKGELQSSSNVDQVLMYLQSGCQVKLEKSVEHKKTPFQPGFYKMNSLRTDGYMYLTDAHGKKYAPVHAQKFIDAGLSRVG